MTDVYFPSNRLSFPLSSKAYLPQNEVKTMLHKHKKSQASA